MNLESTRYLLPIKLSAVISGFAILLIQPAHGNPSKTCLTIPDQAIVKLNALGAKISNAKQTDYARFHQSDTCYLEAWPSNTEQVASLVKIAYQYHVPIRTQGASHSHNGTSLPKKSELLIHTYALNNLTILNNHEISAGSGLPVALINDFLAPYDMKIPIYNEGEINGPTIGGFISAGGIQSGSETYGGFWDQVSELTLVVGEGKIIRIKPENPNFLWVFGAMGQLGIITNVKLKAIDTNFSSKKSPAPANKIDTTFERHGGHYYLINKTVEPYLWVVLFVSQNQVDVATSELINLQTQHEDALRYEPLIKYRIHTRKAPPLLFPHEGDFYAITVWGRKINNKKNILAFNHLNHVFEELVTKKHYHRYIQSEYSKTHDVYKKYFDHKTYKEFANIKSRLDPENLFNQGSFFPTTNKRS